MNQNFEHIIVTKLVLPSEQLFHGFSSYQYR